MFVVPEFSLYSRLLETSSTVYILDNLYMLSHHFFYLGLAKEYLLFNFRIYLFFPWWLKTLIRYLAFNFFLRSALESTIQLQGCSIFLRSPKIKTPKRLNTVFYWWFRPPILYSSSYSNFFSIFNSAVCSFLKINFQSMFLCIEQ